MSFVIFGITYSALEILVYFLIPFSFFLFLLKYIYNNLNTIKIIMGMNEDVLNMLDSEEYEYIKKKKEIKDDDKFKPLY